MDNTELNIQNISDIEIAKLSNDELLEIHKILKEYLEHLEQEIQKVKEND